MRKNATGRPKMDPNGSTYSLGGFRLPKALLERVDRELGHFQAHSGAREYSRSAFLRLLIEEALARREGE